MLTREEVWRLTNVLRNKSRPQDVPAGSLVTLASWCDNSGRLAHVIGLHPWDKYSCMIQYLDEEGQKEPPTVALASNLIMLEEL